MRRISAYIINLFLVIFCTGMQARSQDTITYPLKIKLGIELLGPIMYMSDKNILNTEGSLSVDLNEVKSITVSAGYSDYTYSQDSYTYMSNGIFARAGIDFNLMKPKKTKGLYWGGIGFRYGISRFTTNIQSIKRENYWGSTTSSVPEVTCWGHFIEATPGIRADVFKNLSMGWSIPLRFLIYSGTGKDLKPLYMPGFGNAEKKFRGTLNYYLVWNIPYKKIRVIIKKEVKEEPDDTENTTKGQ